MIRTLYARKPGFYASFPTALVTHDRVHIFFREAHVGDPNTHGRNGRILTCSWPKAPFEAALEDPHGPLSEAPQILFAQHNEMDAIASMPRSGVYLLATRLFAKPGNQAMTTFVSQGAEPAFMQREAVHIKGVDWLVFYGKAFHDQGRILMPAYGGIGDGTPYYPLLIAMDAAGQPSLFAKVPGAPEGMAFNESTFVIHKGRRRVYMRRDTKPFGIWWAESSDLQTWTKPKELIRNAHAPMALVVRGRLLLVYRRIIGEKKAATALMDVDRGVSVDLDVYEGNIYDGGYGDPFVLGKHLAVVYYHGNPEAEPEIRLWSHPLDDLDSLFAL